MRIDITAVNPNGLCTIDGFELRASHGADPAEHLFVSLDAPWISEEAQRIAVADLPGDLTRIAQDIPAVEGDPFAHHVFVPAAFWPLFDPDRPRFVAAYGGRGGARSYSLSRALVLEVLRVSQTDDPARTFLAAREFQTSLKQSSKATITSQIADMGLSNHFQVLETEIRGPRDTLISFSGLATTSTGGGSALSIKSMEGLKLVWVEEAATMSQPSIEILEPTVRAPGSSIWASWNPTTPEDPVHQWLIEDQALVEGKDIVRINTSAVDNPWCSTALRNQMKRMKDRDPAKYHHIFEGGWRTSHDALIFQNQPNVEDLDEEFADLPGRALYGLDWGLGGKDPTAGVRLFYVDTSDDPHNPEPVIYISHELYEQVPLKHLSSALQKKLPGIKHGNTRCDAVPDKIRHLRQEHGFSRITGATKGPNSILTGIERIESADVYIHPRCINAIREFATYQYEEKNSEVDYSKPRDRDNHLIDAVRYAIEKGKPHKVMAVGEVPQVGHGPGVIEGDPLAEVQSAGVPLA